MDIVPTLLDAIGVDLNKYSLDGKSLLELAKGNSKDNERILFWEFLDQTAVRKGKWKLVLKGELITDCQSLLIFTVLDLKLSLKDAPIAYIFNSPFLNFCLHSFSKINAPLVTNHGEMVRS